MITKIMKTDGFKSTQEAKAALIELKRELYSAGISIIETKVSHHPKLMRFFGVIEYKD